MQYFYIRGYGIIILRLFGTWTHFFKDVLAPHLYGGKRHDDGPAGFEPLSLGFGSYSNPLHHHRYIPAVENMQYISGVFKVN